MAQLIIDILPQPNDETCGATCLHAIYRYYGDVMELDGLINDLATLDTGGTLAVVLGTHALERGYKARLYTYDLYAFDPTWFAQKADLRMKLAQQLEFKKDPKLAWATAAYLKFMELGGTVHFQELDEHLLRSYFDREVPVLTGLNATYLYRSMREYRNEFDDLKGLSAGHFVVLHGYDTERSLVQIADPWLKNPISSALGYQVGIDRLINSIMLGIVTYDANLLIIEP